MTIEQQFASKKAAYVKTFTSCWLEIQVLKWELLNGLS